MNPILVLMFAHAPCCTCCNSDDNYAELVVKAMTLVSENEWPPLDPLPNCLARYYHTEENVRKAVDIARGWLKP